MKLCKRFLGLLLTMLLLASTMTAMGAQPIRVMLYGNELAFDVPPQIINDRTMVPLRAIFEALGASVEWNGDTRTVTSVKDGTTISLTIDNATMYVNNTPVTLDSPACIVNDRTLVPVRAVSEAFGISVEWFSDQQAVALGSDDKIYEDPMFHNGLVKFEQDQKYGYLDKKGEIAIANQFDLASEFSNGYALVQIDEVWYSIDTNGTIVAQIPYEVWPTYKDWYHIIVGENSNHQKIGCINTKGEILFLIECEELDRFSEGLAGAKMNGKYGYVNQTGEWVIEPQFDYTVSFSEGCAWVWLDGKMGYINKEGAWIAKPQFDDGEPFSGGMAVVTLNDKKGYINKAGELVIPCIYEDAIDFSEGLAGVQINSKWGFVNQQGQLVIPAQYDAVIGFSEGLAPVYIDEKCGYINKEGAWVAEPQFDYGGIFWNGLAMVTIGVDRKIGFIAKSGYYAIPPQFHNAGCGFYDEGYTVVYDEDGRCVIIDKNGTIISGRYDCIGAALK